MNQPKKTVIKMSLDKAQEALKTAQVDLEQNLLSGAQNRIYYAIFYSVLALSYLEGFATGNHSELQGWFNKKFIYELKVFEEKIFEIYKKTYKNRMKFDYDVTETPAKENLLLELDQAKYFVKIITDYIKTRINIDC